MPLGSGNGLGLGPVPRLRALRTIHSLPAVMRWASPPSSRSAALSLMPRGICQAGCEVSAPHAATLQMEYWRKMVLRLKGTLSGAQQGMACRLRGSISGRQCSEDTGGTSPAIPESRPLPSASHHTWHPLPFHLSPPSPDTRPDPNTVARQVTEPVATPPVLAAHLIRPRSAVATHPLHFPIVIHASYAVSSFPPLSQLNTVLTHTMIIYLLYLISYRMLCYLRSSVVHSVVVGTSMV